MVNCLCVSTCGRAFASRRTLLSHEQICKTCSRLVKYRCGTCGKLFSSIAYLKRHDVVHSKVRKFDCGLCDKSFKRRDHLNRHVVEHSDLRRFTCDICDHSFKRKDDCVRHMERHLGIKNYKCMKCDRSFAGFSNAQSHENNCCVKIQQDVSGSDSHGDDGGLHLIDIEVSDDEQMDGNDTDRL